MKTEIRIDLLRCIKEVWKYKWLIAGVGILVFAITVALTSKAEPTWYKAKASVYSVAYGSYSESKEGVSAMVDYADIITSYKVCNRAALILGDDVMDGYTIMNMISVNYEYASAIMNIEAYSISPEETMKVANAVANVFVIEMQNITGEANVQLLDQAYTYNVSYDGSQGRMKKRVMISVAVMGIISAAFVMKIIFSTKIYSVRDCGLNGELEVLGIIPIYQNDKEDK